MGYPMTYNRVVNRNSLEGDYEHTCETEVQEAKMRIAGDLRRMETDQRDDTQLAWYAEQTGLTVEQVKSVLDLLLKVDD